MPESRARDLATSLGQAVATDNITSAGGLAVTGLNTYTNVSNLPSGYDSTNAGSLAFVTDSDKLYIHTGQGWFNIAIINTNPIWVTQPDASYVLATNATAYLNGTATTITLVARDSEGTAIQWSTETDTGFDNMAYISQSVPSTDYDNDSAVFTIEPMTEDSATSSSGSVTFKASDGVNVITASASFTLTFVSAVSESAETRMLLKASGDDGTNTTINDQSSNNHVITRAGNVSNQAFTPYYPGGYSIFTGLADTDYVKLDASTNYNFDNSGWQLEGWIHPEVFDGGAGGIFEFYTDDNNYFRLFQFNNPGFGIAGKIAGTTYVNLGTSNGTQIPTHKWSHFAVTWDGSKLRAYLNGLLVEESGTISTDLTSTLGSQPLYLMQDYVSTDRYTQGYIYGVRLQTGSSAVTYTGSTYNIPTTALDTDSNTKFHLASGLPYSSDVKGGTVTHNGEVEMRRFIPFDHDAYSVSDHGTSVHFDGTGDLLSVATDSTLELGSSDYTMECWFYMTATPDNVNGLISMGQAGSVSTFASLQLQTNGVVNWFVSQYSTSTPVVNSGICYLNTWYHVAVTRNGNNHTMYINGVSVSTRTVSYTNTIGNTFYVGCGWYATNRDFQGYISDVRLVKGTGTSVYSSAFTPPTAPLSLVSDTGYSTSLLTCNDGPNVYDAGGHSSESIHDLTDRTQTDQTGVQLFGNAVSSTDQTKYASSNMYIPGSTGDYIEIPFPTLKQEDFTWEWWIYPTNVNGSYQAMVDPRQGNTGLPLVWIRNTNRIYYFASSDIIIGTTALQSNTWYHIALVKKGQHACLYLDGVLEGNAADTSTFQNGGVLRIGHRFQTVSAGFYPYSGYIEDMRITKGLTRYPFIPAKTTLASDDQANTKLIACHAASVTTDGAGLQTIAAQGDPTVSDYGPATGMKSVIFDANGDYLTVDLGSDGLGNGDWTVEAWVWIDPGRGTGSRGVFQISDDSSYFEAGANNNIMVAYRNNSNNHKWNYYASNSQYDSDVRSFTAQWTHIALVKNGSNVRLFIDGHIAKTSSDSKDYTSSRYVVIGSYYSTGYLWLGHISNFRIVRGTAVYSHTFTPPTELTA